MAAQRPHVNFQAQVESVLGELVKVATLELTKLFESRYQAVAGSIVQPERWTAQNKSLEYLDKTDGKLRRSIGIQVNENATKGRSDCSQQCWEEEDVTMEHARLVKDEEQVDPACLALGKKDVIRVVVSRNLETEPPASSCPESDIPKQDSTRGPSQPRKPNRGVDEEEKPLMKLEDESDEVGPAAPGLTADDEFPKAQSKEEGVQADTQQPIVSIAKGTAYSPSPSDGAVGVLQVKVWERIRTVREADSHLHLKLKLTSPDQKLMSPCSVQLVNLLAVSEADRADVASAGKACSPVPRDLRHHQGVHTGHRLCCFTRCESGVWRLQKVVAHSRDGYPCDMCGKKFKRRKVLRRHERFHSGEKPYACSHCRKSFALRKSLRRHERFHTDERPHTCAQCGKSFRLRENLKAHLRFHTGEKPFVCPTCGKKFRILRNLEKHSLSQCGFPVPSFRTIAGL